MRAREFVPYLLESYKKITHSPFGTSELKLHKLLYFAQKTSLALTGEPLFDETFEGWKHGPVLTSIRFYFEYLDNEITAELNDTQKYIIDNVIHAYGMYSPWALRNMTHQEQAWKNSRKGLYDGEKGAKDILLEDIKSDAESVRIYDYQYDMYLDEFDDFEGEFISVS